MSADIRRTQLELVVAAFGPAVRELERIAEEIRGRDGVASVLVDSPTVEELEDDAPDIRAPSLTVECYRGHDAASIDREYGLRRIGDGSGSVGPLWVYALAALAEDDDCRYLTVGVPVAAEEMAREREAGGAL